MTKQVERLAALANELFLSVPPVKDHLLSDLDNAFHAGREQGFRRLRDMSTGTVGRLLLDIPPRYSHAARSLPHMPPIEVQQNWTGNHGKYLLRQSVNFVESMVQGYRELSRVPLEQARVLDYGCGWGRLMRLMYSHVDPAQLYGCDPWDQSLQICRAANMQGHFALCDYVPEQVPFENSFELIYAFSVFTHLSQKTADAVMAALRKAIGSDGMLLITVRPETYWDAASIDDANRARLRKLHDTEGFAFVPHQREAIDGEVTYGDTSMTNDYIKHRWQDWRIVKTTINERDPLQRLVFLLPK